jgi:hypothetical protein
MIEPVVQEVVVACSPDHAFRTFTDRVHEWWPVARHSVGGDRVTHVAFEPHVGGRLFERWDDGTEREWGVIEVWEPARRLRFSWRPNPERPAPTEVEVTFTAAPAGTAVRLEHRHWDGLGDDAAEARASYVPGWEFVLGRFVALDTERSGVS